MLHRKLKIVSCELVFLLFLLWLLRYQMVRPPNFEEGTRVRIKGFLREEPVVFGQNQTFALQRIKIKAPRFPELHYGDYLVVTGELRVRVINRFFKQFSLNYPTILKMKKEEGSDQLAWLFRLRRETEATYKQLLPEPQASLLAGIVLGVKQRMPFDFWQALKKTGTVHVVVASGANLALISEPILALLAGPLPRPMALIFASLFVWLYAMMTGFEAPVVRAAIMATTAFLAQFFGRQKDALISLILSGVLMLLIKPLLLFDLGFQLSFSATLGILLFQPRIRPFFRRFSFLADDLSTTLAAQVFVLPLIYFNFKNISLLSPLVNALVLWTIAPLMKLGGIIAGVGLLNKSIAQLLAYPAWLFLTIFVKVIEFFG